MQIVNIAICKMILEILVRVTVILLISREVISTDSTDAIEQVNKQCNSKLDFKSINEFDEFMKKFKEVASSEVHNDLDSSGFKRCLEDKEELFALDELVRNYDRLRPCKFSEVAKLEDHARLYYSAKRRPLGTKFFTLFGVNIGFVCKLNLLAHIKQADNEADQLDFIYSMASPTGWNVLINEHTKKSMKFGTSSHAGNQVTNRLAKLVPGLNLIDQLDYLSFDHVKNNERDMMNLENGVEKGLHRLESGNGEVAEKIGGFLVKIIESCKKLDQLYLNSILSLARLNELGLLVSYSPLANFHENSIMLHKWLAATSFCQLMARVRVQEISDDEREGLPAIKTEIIHDDNLLESRRKLYSYAAELGEIRQEALDNVWLASIPEGAWRQEDQAMFRSKSANEGQSVAMIQLSQFIRGLERDYLSMLKREQESEEL